MRSTLCLVLLVPALWSQGKEWTVRYLAGPFKAAEGITLQLQVLPDRVVLNGQTSIPVEAVTEVAHQTVSFERYGSLAEFAGVDRFGAVLYTALLIGSAVFTNTYDEMPQGYQHRIHVVWFESGRANRLTVEVSKRAYRPLLAALSQATGHPWKDFYDQPPERYVRVAALDPEARAAALRGVQASMRRKEPVPAHLAPE